MSPQRRKTLLRLALTAVILGATLSVVGPGRIVEAFARLDAKAWLITFAAFVVVHGIGTLKWRFFLKLTGVRIPVRDAVRCYSAGLFGNLCLPTAIGGDVLRAGLAMAATRQKTAVILGSLVDRTSDFAALALLAVAGFVVAWNPSSPHHGQDDPTDWVPFAVGGAVAVVAVIAGIVAWRRWHPHGRAHKLLLEFFVALRHLRAHWLQALAAFLVSGVLQVVLMLTHRELGWRIGMPRDLSIWMFIWPVAKLVAMVPISFGGLGVREAAFLGLARPFGIAESVAVASSLAWQAVALVGGLIGGGVWLLMTLRPERPLDRVERRLT